MVHIDYNETWLCCEYYAYNFILAADKKKWKKFYFILNATEQTVYMFENEKVRNNKISGLAYVVCLRFSKGWLEGFSSQEEKIKNDTRFLPCHYYRHLYCTSSSAECSVDPQWYRARLKKATRARHGETGFIFLGRCFLLFSPNLLLYVMH